MKLNEEKCLNQIKTLASNIEKALTLEEAKKYASNILSVSSILDADIDKNVEDKTFYRVNKGHISQTESNPPISEELFYGAVSEQHGAE